MRQIKLSELIDCMENVGFSFYGEYNGSGHHRGWGFVSDDALSLFSAGVELGGYCCANEILPVRPPHCDNLGRDFIISFDEDCVEVDVNPYDYTQD